MRHMLRTCTVRHAARLSTAVWSLETLLCWVLSSWVWSSGSRTYVQLHTRLAGAGGRGGEWATARIAAAQQPWSTRTGTESTLGRSGHSALERRHHRQSVHTQAGTRHVARSRSAHCDRCTRLSRKMRRLSRCELLSDGVDLAVCERMEQVAERQADGAD